VSELSFTYRSSSSGGSGTTVSGGGALGYSQTFNGVLSLTVTHNFNTLTHVSTVLDAAHRVIEADITYGLNNDFILFTTPQSGVVEVIGGTTVSGGGAGLTIAQHEDIDSLVHSISENTYTVLVRDGNGQVTEVDQYQFNGGPLVRKTEINRDSSGTVTSTVERQYDGSGTLIQSLTTALLRDSNGTVTTITTVEVP